MTLSAFYKFAKDRIPPEVNYRRLDVRAQFDGVRYEFEVAMFDDARDVKIGEGRTPEIAMNDLLHQLGYKIPVDMEVTA